MLTEVKRHGVYKIIAGLAVAGLVVSGYAIYQHFSTGTSICNINERFNCDIVNRGPYSEILGVPVAVIGFLGYVWLLVLARELIRAPRAIIRTLLTLSIIGATFFTAYLAWVSKTKIGAWCPTCLISYVIVFSLAVLMCVTRLWRDEIVEV